MPSISAFVNEHVRTRWIVVALASCTAASCRYGYEINDDPGVSLGGSVIDGSDGDGSGATGQGASASSGGMPSNSGGGASGGNMNGGMGGSETGGANTGGTDTGGADTGGSSTGGAGSAPAIEHCNELRFLASAPVLDGIVEDGMFLEDVIPVGWRSAESLPLPPGVSAKFAVAWRPDGLYFFAEVIDPEYNPAPLAEMTYRGDGVEFYVDHDASFDSLPPDYDPIGTAQFLVSGPENESDPSTRTQIRDATAVPFDWIPSGAYALPTASGYTVEAFIGADALNLASWELNSGDKVGIDFAHNVSYPLGTTGPDSNRLGQYFLKVREPLQGNTEDDPYLNESVFCVATLL